MINFRFFILTRHDFFFLAYEVLSDSDKRRQYDMNGGHTGSSSFFRKGTKASNFDMRFDDLFKMFEDDIFGDDLHLRNHFANHFAQHTVNVESDGGSFNFEELFNEQVNLIN